MINEHELLAALEHGYSGYISNGHVRSTDLPGYARQLKEDLEWIGLPEFEILPPVTIHGRLGQDEFSVPISHYKFGQKRNSVNNADPTAVKKDLLTLKNTEGPGLDRDDLRWFCDVLRDARMLLPELWLTDETLRNDLATPKKHLDSVNELFWLGRWKHINPKLTSKEHNVNQALPGSFDWSLVDESTSTNTRINLEIKNLTSSLEHSLFYGNQDANDFVVNGMRGLSKKIPKIISSDINLICLSTYISNATDLQRLSDKILRTHESIDAVLFWIVFADYGQNWRLYPRDADVWQDRKSAIINAHFERPGYRQAKPLLYTHPLWGVLPWQQN